MRLLIYGGTFNPPHLGHADALSCAAAALAADRTLVVPAGIPPHKALAEGSPSAEERLRLCELAFAEADVTPMELQREGKSYTVDTLREISRENPRAELYFLVGTDMLLYMEQWHEFRDFFSLCTLAALPRADGDMTEIERYAAHLRKAYGARIEIIPKTPLPMDSTSLRAALPQRGGADKLCDAVYSEIIRRRLYGAKPDLAWLRGKTDACLKPTRIPHVRGCEETAIRLAMRWGEDPEAAAEAGILHDITKRLSDDEQLRMAQKYGIVLNDADIAAPKTLHALTGAWYSRERFGVPDNIFSAIEWHTTGRAGMTTLEKIVYLADFIEPTRDFPGVELVRTSAFEDLDRAMIEALQMSMDAVTRRGAVPHPRTAEALRWLKTQN